MRLNVFILNFSFLYLCTESLPRFCSHKGDSNWYHSQLIKGVASVIHGYCSIYWGMISLIVWLSDTEVYALKSSQVIRCVSVKNRFRDLHRQPWWWSWRRVRMKYWVLTQHWHSRLPKKMLVHLFSVKIGNLVYLCLLWLECFILDSYCWS
jgi:hypothetical protein